MTTDSPDLGSRRIVATGDAPAAIGTYSQAVMVGGGAGKTVYLSGQIGLDPATMQMVDGIDAQIVRVFENLKAVAAAAGGSARRGGEVQYLPDRPGQFRQGE